MDTQRVGIRARTGTRGKESLNVGQLLHTPRGAFLPEVGSFRSVAVFPIGSLTNSSAAQRPGPSERAQEREKERETE